MQRVGLAEGSHQAPPQTAGPVAGSRSRCRTRGRCRACWRRPGRRGHQPQALVEVVLVLQQHVDHALEVVEGRLEVAAGLLDQRGELAWTAGWWRPAAGAPPGDGQPAPAAAVSLSFISATMSWSRSARAPETVVQVLQQVLSWSSRLATFAESGESPAASLEGRRGVLGGVGEGVDRLRQLRRSIRSARSARPEKACTTSYGEVVRETGIVESSFSWPTPLGSSARYIEPSRVATLIAAPVSVPNWEGVSTLKVDVHVVVVQARRR